MPTVRTSPSTKLRRWWKSRGVRLLDVSSSTTTSLGVEHGEVAFSARGTKTETNYKSKRNWLSCRQKERKKFRKKM
jgi:hypothetical protein